MACEALQFYRSICEVILKIHIIEGEKIEVKVYENQQNSVSRYTDSFTLMISFVFSNELLMSFTRFKYTVQQKLHCVTEP